MEQRFQITLTRMCQMNRDVVKNQKNIQNVIDLWNKIDVINDQVENEKSPFNSKNCCDKTNYNLTNSLDNAEESGNDEIGVTDIKKITSRLSLFSNHFQAKHKRNASGINSLNSNAIQLNYFYTEKELNEMKLNPIYVAHSRVTKFFDISDMKIENNVIVYGSMKSIVNYGAISKNNTVMHTLIWTNELYSNSTTLFKTIFDCFETACLCDSTCYQVARSRLVSSVKYWIDYCLFDDAFLTTIQPFLSRLKEYGMKSSYSLLQSAIKKRQEGFENTFSAKIIKNTHSKVPPTVKFVETILFEMLNPEDLCRQMTLMSFDLFKKIRLNELLMWTSSSKEFQCKSILAITNFSNQVVSYFVDSILSTKHLKRRICVVDTICKLGLEAERLHNYDLLVTISFCFNRSPIHRLKKTFHGLSSSSTEFLSRLYSLTSPENNWRNLRQATLASENVEHAIPYLGIYLSDLTFINDGNEFVLSNGLINYYKCYLLMNVAQHVYNLQQIPYVDLARSPELCSVLSQLFLSTSNNSDITQFNISKLLEPTIKTVPTKTQNGIPFLKPNHQHINRYDISGLTNVSDFISIILPGLQQYLTFIAVSKHSFLGISLDAPLQLLPSADFFTVHLKPQPIPVIIHTSAGWSHLVSLIDMSRPLISQLQSLHATLVDNYAFVVMLIKKEKKSHFYVNLNCSLTQNTFEDGDKLLLYPLIKFNTNSLGYDLDNILFVSEFNYYTTTLFKLPLPALASLPEVVEKTKTINFETNLDRKKSDAVFDALKQSGVEVSIVVAGIFVFVYEKKQLKRAIPIQFIRHVIYAGEYGVVLLLQVEKWLECIDMIDPIVLVGDPVVLYDIIERIDVFTHHTSNRMMGIELDVVLARENRTIPYLVENLLASITLDDQFYSPNAFEGFETYKIAGLANQLDGKKVVDFSQYTLSTRISLLYSFLYAFPQPLIPYDIYQDVVRVAKYPEDEQVNFLNQQLKKITHNRSLLSSLLCALSSHYLYQPQNYAHLLPFQNIILRSPAVPSPLETTTFYLLLKLTPSLTLPTTLTSYINSYYNTPPLLRIVFPDYPSFEIVLKEVNDPLKCCSPTVHNKMIISYKPTTTSFDGDYEKLLATTQDVDVPEKVAFLGDDYYGATHQRKDSIQSIAWEASKCRSLTTPSFGSSSPKHSFLKRTRSPRPTDRSSSSPSSGLAEEIQPSTQFYGIPTDVTPKSPTPNSVTPVLDRSSSTSPSAFKIKKAETPKRAYRSKRVTLTQKGWETQDADVESTANSQFLLKSTK
ncbi:Ras guanine nucleotide exchange factor [Entamoeba marina]